MTSVSDLVVQILKRDTQSVTVGPNVRAVVSFRYGEQDQYYPLFTSKESTFLKHSHYSSFIELCKDSSVLAQDSFTKIVFESNMMALVVRFVAKYLSMDEVRSRFEKMWFSRDSMGSSGFERVYTGAKYHNWVTFLLDEQKGMVHYDRYTNAEQCNVNPLRTQDESSVFWIGCSPVADVILTTLFELTNTTHLEAKVGFFVRRAIHHC
jgi:hypothetical protein